MSVRFLEVAQRELDEAVAHYEADGILILAVAHTHREPGYWRGRLRSDSTGG